MSGLKKQDYKRLLKEAVKNEDYEEASRLKKKVKNPTKVFYVVAEKRKATPMKRKPTQSRMFTPTKNWRFK